MPVIPVASGAPAVAVRLDRGLSSLPALSLYLHLPWCLRKCPYCDFNSHEWRGGAAAGGPPVAGTADAAFADTERQYLAALQADLEASLPQVWGRPVHTVFIGGGTPSLFSPAAIDALLTMVRARLPLVPQAEITMEANPGTFEAQRFRDYAAAGVNRLSIGVQSFDDRLLAAVGRVHDGDQARRAIEVAARHYDSFNIDLMYALPGQRPDDLRRDLDTALSFAPPHLSCYHLTLEPNTLFAASPPAGLPDEDVAADMQE
ncbi:MAG TPA: coproporphyrinogen-III oxidase family protein, partial [Burkholderiaceae bacterium]|nr:coproporphyrinogen-III oxidase family protein [Burkholderiaceae bacterium]